MEISKTTQYSTCCDHESAEIEKIKCGQLLDCESICISKGKSICPTGVCTNSIRDCDPESEEYKEEEANELACSCEDCPVTECPICCYNEKCKELKSNSCALTLTAFSGWFCFPIIFCINVEAWMYFMGFGTKKWSGWLGEWISHSYVPKPIKP